MSALPFFSNLATLELALDYRTNPTRRPEIEANVITLPSSLRKLQHLVLHNTDVQRLKLHEPIHSMVTTSLRSFSYNYCIFDPTDMTKLLETQSKTLETIQLENVALMKGIGHVEFFCSIRRLSQLKQFTLKGCFIEISDEEILSWIREEGYDEEVFLENKIRKQLAREALQEFVMHQREEFPMDLLDVDKTEMLELGGGNWDGMITVFAGAKSAETGEVDF